MILAIGTNVQLNTPDNPRLHGVAAQIVGLTDYGAIVYTAAAGIGYYRAHAHEIVMPAIKTPSLPTGDICKRCGSVNMVRTGACLCCQDCGESDGCG